MVQTHPSNKNVKEWKNKHMPLVKYTAKVCITTIEIYGFV